MRESALVRNQLCGLGYVRPGNLIIFLPIAKNLLQVGFRHSSGCGQFNSVCFSSIQEVESMLKRKNRAMVNRQCKLFMPGHYDDKKKGTKKSGSKKGPKK